METHMTNADRILGLLEGHPAGLTDNEIAALLTLPAPSVRRTRSQLEDQGRVFFLRMDGKASLFSTTEPAFLSELTQ